MMKWVMVKINSIPWFFLNIPLHFLQNSCRCSPPSNCYANSTFCPQVFKVTFQGSSCFLLFCVHIGNASLPPFPWLQSALTILAQEYNYLLTKQAISALRNIVEWYMVWVILVVCNPSIPCAQPLFIRSTVSFVHIMTASCWIPVP